MFFIYEIYYVRETLLAVLSDCPRAFIIRELQQLLEFTFFNVSNLCASSFYISFVQ